MKSELISGLTIIAIIVITVIGILSFVITYNNSLETNTNNNGSDKNCLMCNAAMEYIGLNLHINNLPVNVYKCNNCNLILEFATN